MEEGERTLDPQKQLEIEEDRRRVREALGRMAPKPAAVLVLRASGLSYAEVAQALGIGIGQIGTLLRRAEDTLARRSFVAHLDDGTLRRKIDEAGRE